MNISKADAIAHLAKWHTEGTRIRATYKTLAGLSLIVGTIDSLSPASIKVAGGGAEMLLYFRATSEFDYKDARQLDSEINKNRTNKYPTIIEVKFGDGNHLVVLECFDD
jgi:hypothetical protein